MEVYTKLLTKLNKKYNFEYFNTNLKKNVILLRHDIHLQDIDNGYKMIEIEKLLGIKATYFVLYNIPQESNNNNYQEK